MNFKTTLSLALTLGLLVLAMFLLRSNNSSATHTTSSSYVPPTSLTSRDLIEDELGDVVKIVAHRKGRDEWVFEKIEPEGGGTATWQMTAPLQVKVVSWEVENFSRQLGKLRYEISYKSGQAGAVSAAAAGVDPPEATVTLTNADGKSIGFELGLPASGRSTYVRVAGEETIYVALSNMRNLFKANAISYRDKSAWSFDVNNVTQVDIVDRSSGSAVTYQFVREGARWMMESPTASRATDKVNAALRAISRLRAIEWMDTSNTSLSTFGLQSPALTMKVTVEENVTVPSADDEAEAEPQTEKKITVYSLGVSDRSPIGEDSKAYVLIGNEKTVATVMKTTTDKLVPDMKTWRDLKITVAPVMKATKIEVTTGGESFNLTKNNDLWIFKNGQPADDSAMGQLLRAIHKMSAVAFVDADASALTAYGFDQPQTDIRLTLPDVEGEERFTVGGFTDPVTKRLVYVRHNEASSVAKVKSDTIQPLLRGKMTYRDRSVIDMPTSGFSTLTIVTTDQHEIGNRSITLIQQNGEWSMTQPVKAKIRVDRALALANNLSTLQAEAIVSDSEDQLSAYGLHLPAAQVMISLSTDQAALTKAPEITLAISRHEGQCYVSHSSRVGVFQISNTLCDQVGLEYRADNIFSFEDSQVQEFSIRSQDQLHVFMQQSDVWVYQSEPDLPLNDSNVDELLLRIRDLKTNRYAIYGLKNPGDMGFNNPVHEIMVTLKDGTNQTLLITGQMKSIGSDHGYLAMLEDSDDAFLISTDTVQRFSVSLSELEQ